MASLSERLQWILTADASGAVKGFQEAGVAAETNLAKAEAGSGKLGGQMTKVGAGAMAFAGIAGAALFKTATSFENLAIESDKFSAATGVSIEDGSRLIEVVKHLGIESGALEKSLNFMNKTLGNSPEKFAALGVEIAKDSAGNTDVVATFGNVIDRIDSLTSASDRSRVGSALLGKGWLALAELVKGGSAEMKTAMDQVSAAHVMTEAKATEAKALRDSMNEAKDAASGLALSIGGGVAPMFTTLFHGIGVAVNALGSLDKVTNGAAGTFLGFATAGIGLAGTISFVAGKASTLIKGFHDSEGALTKVGTASKYAAIGMGLLAIGVAAYNFQQQHNEKQNATFVKGLETAITSTDEMAKKSIPEMLMVWQRWQDLSPEQAVDKLTQASLGSTVALRDQALASSTLRDSLAKQGITVDILNASIDKQTAANKVATDVEALNAAALDDGTAAKEASTLWTDNYKNAVDAAKKAGDEYTKGLQDTAKALQDEAKAQTATVDAMHAAADANFALADASDTYNTFLAGQSKAIRDAKGDQSAINKIYREGTTDADAVATATANLTAQAQLAQGVTQTQTEKLDIWNQSMINSASKASPALRAEIINYIGTVNQIPAEKMTEINAAIAAGDLPLAETLLNDASRARRLTITADADTTQATIDLNNATKPRTVDVIPNAVGWTDPYLPWKMPTVKVAVLPAHAAGTTNAENAFIAGEQGPELVTGHQGSTVFTAEQTAALLGPTVAGGSTTTIINHWPPGLNPAAVAQAQRDYQRRGGRS